RSVNTLSFDAPVDADFRRSHKILASKHPFDHELLRCMFERQADAAGVTGAGTAALEMFFLAGDTFDAVKGKKNRLEDCGLPCSVRANDRNKALRKREAGLLVLAEVFHFEGFKQQGRYPPLA